MAQRLTPKVWTGSGGNHFWFHSPAGTKCGKPYPGIDLKAEGGFVIVPPSKILIPEHQGRAYTWEFRPWDTQISDAPAWLSAKPKGQGVQLDAEDPWVVKEATADLLTHPGSPEGERRKTLCQLVGVHLARGDSFGSLKFMVEAWAKRCSPPFEEWEKHLLRLWEKEEAKAERMTTIISPSPSSGFGVAGREGNNSQPSALSIRTNEEAKTNTQAQAELIPSFPPSAESGEADRLSAEEPTAQAPQLGDTNQSAGPLASDQSGGGIGQGLPSAVGSADGSVADGSGESPLPLARGFAASKSQCQSQNQTLSPVPQADAQAESQWPTLSADAYHGLFGEMLHAVSPETEADPPGLLLGWLTCFGNIIGKGAWVSVGPRLHHPALYSGIVGRTSDAKGDSWAAAVWPFKLLEQAWASACIAHGVGSGEGLIERIADAQTVMDKKGNAQVIPGAPDKRCLLRLSELSQCFKKQRRENATLSEHLREAWDGEPIHIPNCKGNALSASDYSVSVVGDITPGVIRKLLEGGTEAFDGFANRFLWAAVKRSGFLPNGGSMEPLKPYLGRLQSALTFAKSAGELRRNAEAERLWEEAYPSLACSGDDVPHTDRARPYVVRLSMLYALADSSKTIKVEHLKAALAVWSYCRQSALKIFGGGQGSEPDPLWLRLLNAIGKAPGIRRSELLRAFRSISADELDGLLSSLKAKGLAHRRMVSPESGGRPAECWYPGPTDGDGESGVNDNPSPSSPWIVQADAESVGKEGNNSAQAQDGSYFLPSHASGESEGPKATSQASELFPSIPSAEPKSESEKGERSEVVVSLTADAFLAELTETKNADADGVELWIEEQTAMPFTTPYPELTELIHSQDAMPICDGETGIRVSFDADADAIERLRRYDGLTLEKWKPCLGFWKQDIHARRWTAVYLTPKKCS